MLLETGVNVSIVAPLPPKFTLAPPPPSVVTVLPVSGGGSGGGSTFVYTQITPATVWTITHNLGRRPAAVSLFSPDYAIQYDEFRVQHINTNQLRVSVDIATPGIALIN